MRRPDVLTHAGIWPTDVFLADPRKSLENMKILMFICKQDYFVVLGNSARAGQCVNWNM